MQHFYIASNFDAVLFFELNMLRRCCTLLTNKYPLSLVVSMINSTESKVKQIILSYFSSFHPILMHFFVVGKMLIDMTYFESIN